MNNNIHFHFWIDEASQSLQPCNCQSSGVEFNPLSSKSTYIYMYTVKSAYKCPPITLYKELPFIRNWFSFPNHYQGMSSLYVYKELWLKDTNFHGPNKFLISRFYCRMNWFFPGKMKSTLYNSALGINKMLETMSDALKRRWKSLFC